MEKSQIDLPNRVVFIVDSKTPTRIAEVPLTAIACEAFQNQMELAGPGRWLFPGESNRTGHQSEFKRSFVPFAPTTPRPNRLPRSARASGL